MKSMDMMGAVGTDMTKMPPQNMEAIMKEMYRMMMEMHMEMKEMKPMMQKCMNHTSTMEKMK